LTGQLLAAHNASFDLGVLFALLRYFRLGPADIAIVDSLAVARKAWPSLHNHQLPTVAKHVGAALDHHDARSDAVTCAAILCAAEREQPGMMERMVKRRSTG